MSVVLEIGFIDGKPIYGWSCGKVILFNDGLWGVGARVFITFLGFTGEVFPLDYRRGIPLAVRSYTVIQLEL